MKIHPNRQAARQAMRDYWEKVSALQEEYGVKEENEDSCCMVYLKAHYKNESGEIETVISN